MNIYSSASDKHGSENQYNTCKTIICVKLFSFSFNIIPILIINSKKSIETKCLAIRNNVL